MEEVKNMAAFFQIPRVPLASFFSGQALIVEQKGSLGSAVVMSVVAFLDN